MTESTSVSQSQYDQLDKAVSSVVATAHAMQITDQASYEMAGRYLTEYINPGIKTVKDVFDGPCKAARAAYTGITGLRKKLTDPLDQAKVIVRNNMQQYYAECERQRLEAEAVAEKEALAEAVAPEGDLQPAISAPQPIAAAPPSAEGVSMRMVWTAKVTDKVAFLRAAIDRPDLIALIKVDETTLTKMVRAQDGAVRYAGTHIEKVAESRSMSR